MEHQPFSQLRERQLVYTDISAQAVLVYLFAALFLVYHVLQHYGITFTTVSDRLIETSAAFVPARLVLDQTQLGSTSSWSQRRAAKAESMRRMLGLNHSRISTPSSLLGRIYSTAATSSASSITSNAPAGLGNWDNSCYQNSVLQGLTSLQALRLYLRTWTPKVAESSTISAMQDITDKLQDPYQNGKQIWTPAKLKSMSSLQQQDAQEYYSKVVEEMDKEVGKSQKSKTVQEGCEVITKQNIEQAKIAEFDARQNPLEGMLAQQVVCTACGFSEGLSLIPFNCLTLPLDSKPEVTLEESLSEYTKLEPITGVECAKCTLLKTQKELERLAKPPQQQNAQTKVAGQLPPELQAQVKLRLSAVQKALEADDFSDDTLSKTCQIPKNVRVSSTKTRQAILARMPANLIIHINRSVFDEMTGMLRKNYAAVQYPAMLDLGPWILGNAATRVDQPHHTQVGLPREALWKYVYRIKAIVTHYGRHENGHYIAYRQAPVFSENDMLADEKDLDLSTERKQQWWRLSDETVSSVSEADVLDQGGVFMLFYERVHDHELPAKSAPEPVALAQSAMPEILPSEQPHIAETGEISISEASFTEDESEADIEEEVVRKASPPSPLLMRTASAAIPNDGIWNVGRFVAAS